MRSARDYGPDGGPNNLLLRGQTVTATDGGAATQFLYDGDALVAEYNGSNVLQRRHVHNVGADVPMVTYEGTGLGTISQLSTDRQGSIAAQLTSGGVQSGLNAYDEYGIPGAGNSGRFQYTGQIWLAELGMYHYKGRIYSPTLGRFMQTDPIGYDDQFNLYAYVGNDPINNSDPSGEETCTGSHIECDEGGIAPGLSGSSSGARRRQSHIGMNGFPQDGPPPELPVDGETGATMQDSMDMRDVMAQRMTQDQLMERREARFTGAMTALTAMDGVAVGALANTGVRALVREAPAIGRSFRRHLLSAEGPGRGLRAHGVGRVGQIRLGGNRLIIRLDRERVTGRFHVNIESQTMGFNKHIYVNPLYWFFR